MRSGAPLYPFRTLAEPAIFLSEKLKMGVCDAGKRDEEQAWSSLHLRQITHRSVLTACFQGRGICHRKALLAGLQGDSVAF